MVNIKRVGTFEKGSEIMEKETWRLCDRCICAIKSRGEKLFVGDEVPFDEEDDSTFICEWCEEEATLYECI